MCAAFITGRVFANRRGRFDVMPVDAMNRGSDYNVNILGTKRLRRHRPTWPRTKEAISNEMASRVLHDPPKRAILQVKLDHLN
jgi:hypothetical protein